MGKLQKSISQWRELNKRERVQLGRFVFLLPLTRLALSLLGFRRALRMAESERVVGAGVIGESDWSLALSQARLVAIAAHHGFYRANCLHQALALCWVLKRQGLPVKIRIGVKPSTQVFQAHAWVEMAGTVLGQAINEYTAFDRPATDSDTNTFV